MEIKENIKQKKNKRSTEVSGIIEKVHNRVQYIGKRKWFRKCKRNSSRVWKKIDCKTKKIRKVRKTREKEALEGESY